MLCEYSIVHLSLAEMGICDLALSRLHLLADVCRYGILQFFLPKRMKRRVEMSSKDGQKTAEETVGTTDCIPVGFDDLNGTVEVDLIAQKLSTEPASSTTSSEDTPN